METLIQRLEEVMREMGWEQADLRRVSGQSSSTVSQWLGNSSKLIKSIGKMEAAEQPTKTAIHNHGTMLVGSVAGNTFFIGGVDPAEFEKLIRGRPKT